MLYLLYGDDFKINLETNKIIQEHNINDIDISRYDMDSYNFKDIIEDANSMSLFDNTKLIIVSNASIFTTAKTGIDTTIYEKYIENKNDNIIIIFTTEDNLDERKKVVKLINKYGIVKYFDKSITNNDISNILGEYKMDNATIAEFIELVGNDFYNVVNEIDKLKLYKDTDYNITRNDVMNIVTNNIELDIFKFIDYIMENNKGQALKMYKNLLLYGSEPIQIIIMLANKYRLFYQVKTLTILGYNEASIAKELKQSPKYIYVLNKLSKKYSKDFLLNEISKLAKLDIDIKTGKIEADIGLELYILGN